MFGPSVPSAGPLDARICILAEAPGTEESSRGIPLVGPSGHELRRQLNIVGVNLDDCLKINVFSRQPGDNNLALYGVPKGAGGLEALGPLSLNPITFLHPDHLHELHRVYGEIAEAAPNVLIALGNTATWALGLGQGIASLRGSIHTADIPGLGRPLKVLPTYHPAAVLRQWDLRSIVLTDLEKAYAESFSPEFCFDNSELWINPTLEDIREFDDLHMVRASICACDIETKRGQITCLSFAPTVGYSLVIPFWIEGASPNYWATVEEEAEAWGYVRRWLERPDLTLVFQNGTYDAQYLQRHATIRGMTEDTMLMSHSLWSELPKGLGHLGASFANVPSWKQMRRFTREEALKRDD